MKARPFEHGMRRASVVALLWVSTLPAAFGMDAPAVIEAARASHPDVQWQAHRVVTGDLTCSGRRDTAALGTLGSRLWVAILPGSRSGKAEAVEIDSALRADRTTVSIERQDAEMGTGAPGDVGPLPGFGRSTTCKGLKLDDKLIDTVHIYWNRRDRRFQTWQR